jgi:hypothetical protein
MNTHGVQSSYKNLAVRLLLLENGSTDFFWNEIGSWKYCSCFDHSYFALLTKIPNIEAVKGEIFCVQFTELTNNGLLINR